MQIDRLLEGVDLSALFAAVVLLGAGLSIYLMQISWQSDVERGDGTWLRYLRRAALTTIGLSFVWTLSYGLTKNWQPWPPVVAIIMSFDFYLAVHVVTIRLREYNLRHRFMGKNWARNGH
jgi:hypothetical protein